MTPPTPAPPDPLRRLGRWFVRGGWYLLVVVLSLGLFCCVPFVHAALRTGRPLMWVWAVLYTAANVALFVVGPRPDIGNYAIALMVVAAVHTTILRRQVWPREHPAPSEPSVAAQAGDPAVAAVLAARERRRGARELAAQDPLMARELRIGRPDLGGGYDDGGLVDLNSAPGPVIARVCGIDPAVADRIEQARAGGVVFGSVEDVFALADVPYPLWDRIRDRAVVLPG